MMTLLRRYQLDYNVPCSGRLSRPVSVPPSRPEPISRPKSTPVNRPMLAPSSRAMSSPTTLTVRKGKRAVSPRNAKKTTTKTKPNRASRSLRKERNKKGVNGKSVTASEEVSGEEHKHVNDYTDLSEDNSEDTAPLANTKSSPTQNGTVEENGEETDRDSIESIRCDEQLTHEETVSFEGSDSDTQDVVSSDTCKQSRSSEGMNSWT